MSRIEFFERSHRYKLDGEFVPGVTTILNETVPKDLTNWAARSVAEFVADRLLLVDDEISHDASGLLSSIERSAVPFGVTFKRGSRESVAKVLAAVPKNDRDTAARRGTEVHRLARRIIEGEVVTVPDELVEHVDAHLAFLDQWQSHDELAERLVANASLSYCGTFDLMTTLIDGRRWLLDLKTTRSGVFPEVALQLAGYRYAELMQSGDDDEPMPQVDACGVVWLGPGGYKFYEAQTGPPVWAMFQRCRRNFDYLRTNHPRGWNESPLLRELTAFDRAEFAS